MVSIASSECGLSAGRAKLHSRPVVKANGQEFNTTSEEIRRLHRRVLELDEYTEYDLLKERSADAMADAIPAQVALQLHVLLDSANKRVQLVVRKSCTVCARACCIVHNVLFVRII